MALRSYLVLMLLLAVLSVVQWSGLPLHLRGVLGDAGGMPGTSGLIAVIVIQADAKPCGPEVVSPVKVTLAGVACRFAPQDANGQTEYHVFANTSGGRVGPPSVLAFDLIGPGIDPKTIQFVHPGYGVVIHTTSVTLATTGFCGRLLDEDGRGLEAQRIHLALHRAGQSTQNIVTTMTGPDGRFDVEKVKLPAWVAGVGALEGIGDVEWTPSTAAPLAVSSGDDIVVQFARQRRMAVSVRLKNEAGAASRSNLRSRDGGAAFLSAWPLEPGAHANELLTASRQGTLQAFETIAVPKTGRYRIEALALFGGYAVAEFDFGDPTLTALDFDFSQSGDSLRGVLERNGAAASGLMVVDGTPSWEVIRAARDQMLDRTRRVARNRPVGAIDITSAAGRFELRAHSPEQKEVTVVLSGLGFYRVAKSALAQGTVDLLDDPEAPRLEGRVTDPSGNPVEGAEIAVTTHRGTSLAGAFLPDPIDGFRVRTDADGRYLVRGLLEGDYEVGVVSPRAPAGRGVRRPGSTRMIAPTEIDEIIGAPAPVRTEKGRPGRADFTTKAPSATR